jgi:hypothetical protein
MKTSTKTEPQLIWTVYIPVRASNCSNGNAFQETIERFNANSTPFGSGPPPAQDVAAPADQLAQLISRLEPDELWIPVGSGYPVDHRLTRNRSLRRLAQARGRLSQVPVSMYEDLPYAAAPQQATQIEAAFDAAKRPAHAQPRGHNGCFPAESAIGFGLRFAIQTFLHGTTPP